MGEEQEVEPLTVSMRRHGLFALERLVYSLLSQVPKP